MSSMAMNETLSSVPASNPPCAWETKSKEDVPHSTATVLFPWKLHEMLNSARHNNSQGRFDSIVSWRPHGRAFRVNNKEAFAAVVMPRFFNQTKYKSFQRQLHLWGFKRIEQGEDIGAYFHMYFLRGQPDLCRYMRRHRSAKASSQHSPEGQHERPIGPQESVIDQHSFVQSPPPTSMTAQTRTGPNRNQISQRETNMILPQSSPVNRPLIRSNISPFRLDHTPADNARAGGMHDQLAINYPLLGAFSSLHPTNMGGEYLPAVSELELGCGSSSHINTFAAVSASSSRHASGGIITPPHGAPSSPGLPFPWKLHEMLNEAEREGYNHIVSWTAHGRALKVHESEIFAASIMPRHFRQTKFKSFQRQLNLWGFERVPKGRDKGCYFHPHFLRDDKEKCKMMTHIGVKGNSIRRPTASMSQASYEKPEDFIAAIKDPQIRNNIQTLHTLITREAPELVPHTKVKGTLGYGKFKYHYKTAGRHGEWCKLGLSYGKQITMHCSGRTNGQLVLKGFTTRFPKAKVGLTSMRFQKVSDLDQDALKEVIRNTANADEEEVAS